MKITPLEIRQKTFEKNFRGYEKEEVHAFLLTLSQEWERMQDEVKELRYRLDSSEREVQKLREVENSLYKTLKTAEDTGANVIEQARKTAELHLRETQMKADAMLNEAKLKAKDTLEESETRAKQVIADMEDRLKSLVENYRKLESSREDLITDLRRLASDLQERVERALNTTKNFDPEAHLANVKREAKKIIFPNLEFDRSIQSTEVTKTEAVKPDVAVNAYKAPVVPEPVKEVVHQPVVANEPKKVMKSFFDEIG